MNIGLLFLTLLNVLLLAGLSFSLFLRIKEKKEDQRLTRGLQLLQNKISILEDLSDRTDEQVHKLVHVIDQKANEVRYHVTSADEKIEHIQNAISKALEASKDISKNFNQQIQQTDLENFTQALSQQNQKIEQSITATAFDSVKQDLEAQNNLRTEFNKTLKPIIENTLPQKFIEKNFSEKITLEKTTTVNGALGEKSIRPMEFRKIVSHRG